MKPSLDLEIVWTAAALRVIDDSGDLPKWVTLDTLPYTPRHINDALKKHGLTSGWIKWACGNELWTLGTQIATKAGK